MGQAVKKKVVKTKDSKVENALFICFLSTNDFSALMFRKGKEKSCRGKALFGPAGGEFIRGEQQQQS